MTDYFYDVGSFHRAVSTSNETAQLWFDRGLTWCYGFNHKEATTCFEEALKHDPNLAMAYWGIAHTLGPNYNKPWRLFDPRDLKASVKRAHEVIEKANELASTTTPVEQALIKAMRHKYPQDVPSEDLMGWNRGYADAMERVYGEFPNDLDVAALFGEALINLTPRQLWDLKTGEPTPGSRVLEAKAVLERAMKQEGAMSNPGLLHIYIHMIEMSATPEEGLIAADNLRNLCPDAGHLEHMPTHIDVLVGDYRRSINSNRSSVEADKKYAAREGIMNFYSMYRMHSYQNLIYGAMLAGQSDLAIRTCTEMEAQLPDELMRLKLPPMIEWLEIFNTIRVHVLVRFGRWEDILSMKFPEDKEFYIGTTAMMHYGRAIASAALTRIEDAEKEKALFQATAKRVPPTRLAFPNQFKDILGIAEAMIDGELEYRKGNYTEAWEGLSRAVEREDNLIHAEPWGWMVPTRHAFGALLLEQGHAEKAAKMYAEDLGFDKKLSPGHRHPRNIFAMRGYHECLMKLGRTSEASLLEPDIKVGEAAADIPIPSSCFCRLKTENTNGHTTGRNNGEDCCRL